MHRSASVQQRKRRCRTGKGPVPVQPAHSACMSAASALSQEPSIMPLARLRRAARGRSRSHHARGLHHSWRAP